MMERFTDRARRAVVLAQEQAKSLGASIIGAEHLFLAVIYEHEGIAAQALAELGVTELNVRTILLNRQNGDEGQSGAQADIGPVMKNTLELSLREALQLGNNYIDTEHLLLAIMRVNDETVTQILAAQNVDPQQVRDKVVELWSKNNETRRKGQVRRPTTKENVLYKFGRDLTAAASEGQVDPVIGRNEEFGHLIEILAQRTNSIPILVGEPGINKTAVAERLAEAIVSNDVPPTLRKKTLYKLPLAPLVDPAVNATHASELVDRLKSESNIVLFIDEIHYLFPDDTNQELKNYLADLKSLIMDGGFPIIGATTLQDYHKYIEKSANLGRKFQTIKVDEPSEGHAIEILKGTRSELEAHHRLSITDDALEAAAVLGHRYIRQSYLPENAIELLDRAGARLRIKYLTASPEIQSCDKHILDVKRKKEAAIDGQDYEQAALLRSEEQQLLAKREVLDRDWRQRGDDLGELDAKTVVQIASELSGVSTKRLEATLDKVIRGVTRSSPSHPEQASQYRLLGDQPLQGASGDLLETLSKAKEIASIINRSRNLSSFVLAIDGSWGAGKSTLLNQINMCLKSEPNIRTVHFNAWTAQRDDALETLIKSVLLEMDKNLLRKGYNKLKGKKHITFFGKLLVGVSARIFGVNKLVDQFWEQLQVDAKVRNEVNTTLFDMLDSWTKNVPTGSPRNALVVFVDDLDRCPDEVVMRVCEAIKLYLDAPGLLFVIGCDISGLAQGVARSVGGEAQRGHQYLEKIVQVVHRVHSLSAAKTKRLVDGFAVNAGVGGLMDENVLDILCERASRNPRQIKRVINSFVLESHLNPSWCAPPLGSDLLVISIIMQHLYADFFNWIVSGDSGSDPIGDFLDYVEVRSRIFDPPPINDAWWSTVNDLFRSHGFATPDRSASNLEELTLAFASLEKRLPKHFPNLFDDVAFISLLRGVGDEETRIALRYQLTNEPMQTEAMA